MRATYHQPFAQPGPLYPFKIEEIGLGRENAGKFRVTNVLSERELCVSDSYAEAETNVIAENERIAQVEKEHATELRTEAPEEHF